MNYEIKTIAGIQCVFSHIESANSITIQVLVKAGSIYETKELNWISHFLEHLFFKWWKKYKNPREVAEAVDNFGWTFNAFTGENYAWYYVKSAPEFVSKSIDVLGDMLVDAQFPKEELEREKGVVIQEIMMYQDEPYDLVSQKRQEYYYGDNSYWWPVSGPVENIKNFNQSDLFSHKENLYTKDNLVIVVAWNIIDESLIIEKIYESFVKLPETKKLDVPLFSNHFPKKSQEFFDKKTEQNHLIVSAPWFIAESDEKYSATVLANILWWNMSSRLFQNIREKEGLCYYISARHSANPQYGTFMIRAWLEKDRFSYGVEKIENEIQRIVNQDITNLELQKSLWYLRWQIQMWIESSDELAYFLWTQYLLYGKIKTLDEVLKKYETLTLDDINKIANKLRKENLYTYWIQ